MTAVGSSGNLGSVGHSFTYKGNATTTTEYVDTFTSTVTPTSGTATDTVYSYTYDNNGNICTITKANTLQYTYNYDEAGQLVRADDAVQNKTFTYTYDVGGNITAKKEYAYTTGTLGSVVDTISYTYDGTWKDKLISFDGKNILYTDEQTSEPTGNPLTYDGYTFDWNGRILDSITGNSKTIEFKYNESGLRTKKAVTQNNVTTNYSYIWNDSKLVSQSDGTNTFYFFYAGGNTAGYGTSEYAPDGFVLNGTDIYFYTKNLQGDVTGIVNASGVVVTNYAYDAWGNILSVTGTLASTLGAANPFRYRGYYYDAETGLYYLQSRYYNPEWGRFLNADDFERLRKTHLINPITFEMNVFSYGINNPIIYCDYNGHASQSNDFSQSMADALVIIGVTWFIHDYCYAAIGINSDSVSSDSRYDNSKKGCMKINIEKLCRVPTSENGIEYCEFYYYIYNFYSQIGDVVFDIMAELACQKFFDEFASKHNNVYKTDQTKKREFLFSASCVSNEIKQHCLAYWWAVKLISFQDTSAVLCIGKGGNKNEIIKSTKCIDIFEQDVTKLRDKSVFNYYNGIRDCYYRTLADPFFYPNRSSSAGYTPGITGTRINNVREEWKDAKIPV